MSAELWLSREEIAQMCRATTKKLQLEFLRLNGVRHYVDRHGWPVVSRAVAEADGAIAAKPDAGEWRSNKFKAA
jgi:hypothetical protein